jgi:hypothetical protein
VLVGALAVADRGPARLLSTRAAVAGGRLSYGLYLMRLRLGPPRWWSGRQVTLRLGEARLGGLR